MLSFLPTHAGSCNMIMAGYGQHVTKRLTALPGLSERWLTIFSCAGNMKPNWEAAPCRVCNTCHFLTVYNGISLLLAV
jgi:hypothetical protein